MWFLPEMAEFFVLLWRNKSEAPLKGLRRASHPVQPRAGRPEAHLRRGAHGSVSAAYACREAGWSVAVIESRPFAGTCAIAATATLSRLLDLQGEPHRTRVGARRQGPPVRQRECNRTGQGAGTLPARDEILFHAAAKRPACEGCLSSA